MAKIVDREKKKRQILKAAVKVFARKGATDTKMQDIADEAGVAKGTLYLYFKNKNSILKNIFNDNPYSNTEHWEKIFKSDISPEEKLRKVCVSLIELVCDSDELPSIVTEVFGLIGNRKGKAQEYFGHSPSEIMIMTANTVSELSKKYKTKVDRKMYSLEILSMMLGIILMKAVSLNGFDGNFAADMMDDYLENFINRFK